MNWPIFIAGLGAVFITLGHFAAGSMLPKINAALDFIEHGGAAVIITSPQLLKKAIAGNAGTRIYLKEP